MEAEGVDVGFEVESRGEGRALLGAGRCAEEGAWAGLSEAAGDEGRVGTCSGEASVRRVCGGLG